MIEPVPGAPHSRVARLVFPDQTNHHGTLFGGDALALMTAAASHAAARRSRLPVVLAATERIDFRAPIRLGQIAEADAWVSAVGRSSIAVEAVLHGEDLTTGVRTRSTEGRFVFVAVDAAGKPTPVVLPPPSDLVVPDTWTTERVQPGMTTHAGRLLGGELMGLLDTVAFVAATRVARVPLVTASIGSVRLDHPISVGDLVVVGAEVIARGRRSITTRTRVGMDGPRDREPAAVADLVLVAV